MAFLTALPSIDPSVTMMPTLSRTNSRAKSEIRSVVPSDHLHTISMFFPSIHPKSRNVLRNYPSEGRERQLQLHCVATACAEYGCLAMLKRRPRESLRAPLERLDAAIELAENEETVIGEINPPLPKPRNRSPASRRS